MRVLPLPGPAMISSGPSAVAAARCCGSSPSSSDPVPAAVTGVAGSAGASAEQPPRRHGGAAQAGCRAGYPAPFGFILGRGRRQAGHREQRRARQFTRLEQPDRAVLAVVTRVPDDLAAPQPGDALAEQRPARTAQVIERDLAQDAQLRPERGDQPADLADHLLALRPGRQHLADDLRELDQAGEPGGAGRPEARGTVGQLRYPVQDADGERLTALRADGVQVTGLLGIDPDPALAVPVQVVLPLLGKELDRARRPSPVRSAAAMAK